MADEKAAQDGSAVIDINRIMQMIPHRYPFLLIDRVVDVVTGESAIGIKNVTVNESFFQGHFPDSPIMPGVLIIEAMAQTAGVLGFASVDKQPDDKRLYLFAGVDGVRFKRPVVPGDRLMMTAEIDSCKRNIWRFCCSAKVDGLLVCEATILCALEAP